MFSWSSPASRSKSNRTLGSSGGSSTSAYPATRGAQATPAHSRSDHLSSFLNDGTLKRSTRRVSRDDSTYDTVFQTKSGHALILRVHVAPREGVAPAMTLVGVKASHPWLDNKMRVIGYPHIISDIQWNASGMLLGRAVNDVVQHLQLNPPDIIQITDKSLQKLQQGQGGKRSGSHLRQPSDPPYHLGHPPPPDYEAAVQTEDVSPRAGGETFHMPIPEVPSSFPEVEKMTKSEMKKLLEDEGEFKSHVDQMSAVTTMNDLLTSISNGNVETAKANLTHEEELETLHAEVSVVRSTLQEKIAAFEKLEKKYDKLCTPVDPRKVVKQLHGAKREAFGESEKTASEWLEDECEMDVDEFTKKFTEQRSVFHIRAAKIERLSDQR